MSSYFCLCPSDLSLMGSVHVIPWNLGTITKWAFSWESARVLTFWPHMFTPNSIPDQCHLIITMTWKYNTDKPRNSIQMENNIHICRINKSEGCVVCTTSIAIQFCRCLRDKHWGDGDSEVFIIIIWECPFRQCKTQRVEWFPVYYLKSMTSFIGVFSRGQSQLCGVTLGYQIIDCLPALFLQKLSPDPLRSWWGGSCSHYCRW